MNIKDREHPSHSEGLRHGECPLWKPKQYENEHSGRADDRYRKSEIKNQKPDLSLLFKQYPSLFSSVWFQFSAVSDCPLLTQRQYTGTNQCAEGSRLTLEGNRPYIDLHTHSTASDGSMTPAELVRHAYGKGLAAVAITDHDTVNGVSQAIEEGQMLGIEVIPGVEISVDFNPEMHLLGYFPDGHVQAILKTLEELREKREQRNPRIINKLNELGFEITLSEVKRLALGGNVGRPHMARALMDKGYVASIEEAFDKYLAGGRPAYFKKDKLTPASGIAEIVRAGGVPVLAHPIYLGMTGERLDQLLGDLAEIGLMGVEAYYTENTPEQTEELLQLATKYKLLVTGGSDFHGRFKPDIEIGVGKGSLKVPYCLLSALKQPRFAPN